MFERRNIGIVAHIDAGKTTLTEQILHATGVLRRPGSVEDGSTVSDWQRQEQERGITIGSAAVVCRWRDVELTLIDTPGHVDFSIEVSRALTVLDGAVVIISGADGIQSQTQTVWHQAAEHDLPAIGFINKLDRPGYDHDGLMSAIVERLGVEPLPLQIPVTFGGSELTVLDLLNGELQTWQLVQKKAGVRSPNVVEPLDDYHDMMRHEALERIADAIAPHDDDFAERYLAGELLSPQRWLLAIRKATLARRVMPLVFGVARSGVGLEALLDTVISVLPSPGEGQGPRVFQANTGSPAGRLRSKRPAAFVFKTERGQGGRRTAHIRVFSGELTASSSLQVVGDEVSFVPLQLVRLIGSDPIEVSSLGAGTVGAIILGVDAPRLRTGQTLSSSPDLPFTFESILTPTPVISVSLEASDEAEDRRMRTLLDEAVHDDPSLALLHDTGSGQTLLAGMGELHLELVVERLRKDEGLRLRVGQPRPRRRCMITRPSDVSLLHVHPGTSRGSVEIRLVLEPSEQSELTKVNYELEPSLDPVNRRALEAGILHSLIHDADLVGVAPVVRRLRVSGGAVTPRLLWDAGHRVAGAAVTEAALQIAEPWMSVTLTTPEEMVGRVTGDLARRRAKILGSESRGAIQVLHVEAPLAEMIQYATALRSLTAGRGTFSMQPSRFRIHAGRAS